MHNDRTWQNYDPLSRLDHFFYSVQRSFLQTLPLPLQYQKTLHIRAPSSSFLKRKLRFGISVLIYFQKSTSVPNTCFFTMKASGIDLAINRKRLARLHIKLADFTRCAVMPLHAEGHNTQSISTAGFLQTD